MEIQALKTYIKTAELLHFGRASRACNLSPSALTRTIQRLEEEVGVALFLRDNRSVVITEAGNSLLNYARNAVHEWQKFQDSIDADSQSVTGGLSIYASVTAVYSLLPGLLEAYRETYPDVQLELRTGDAERAIDQVLSGEIDLAVAALPDQKQERFEFLPLVETPLVFISTQTLEHIDFKKEALIVPQSGSARQRLGHWLKERDIEPHISTEVSGNEALIAMVRLGAGIGIVPLLALERSPLRDEVNIIKNSPQLAPYEVGLCVGKRNINRPSVRAMWELASAL
jgi:LysR family positive regulator for ilvC